MFSSHFNRFSLRLTLAHAFIFLLFAGCQLWSGGREDAPPAGAAPEDLRSEIPFAMREPDVFEAEIVVAAGGAERRTRLARSGARRRFDYDFGTSDQLALIENERVFLLDPARRLYAEISREGAAAGGEESLVSNLGAGAHSGTKFDKLETIENVTRYRVAPDGGELAEIFVWVDETVGLPVRQEFYSIAGGEKILTMTIELKNLRLEVDENLFAPPADFKKTSEDELRRARRAGAGD